MRRQSGNNLGENAKLNSRLQVKELTLGTSVGDGSRLKVNYDYGELMTNGVDVDETKNAGNIAKQTVTFSGLANPFVQTYKYDSLWGMGSGLPGDAGDGVRPAVIALFGSIMSLFW